jgi:hypothetical protein
MFRSILVSVVVVVLSIVPRVIVLEEGFLPQNNLKIPIGSLEAKGINEAQFNKVMDRIEAIYGPEIKARGARLVIKRLWTNETVNASAQRVGNDYVLNMYGGLARHESITQDGMALVVCHEMGHHLGGAPKYDAGADWAANEGQADYFANLKCLRRMFAGRGADEFTRVKGDDAGPRAACEAAWKSAADRDLCVRESMAGMSVTTLLRILGGEPVQPRFDTPDPAQVAETYDAHPAAQCRLDTYFAGSICGRAVNEQVDEIDPTKGTCTAEGGQTAGLRPRCWYQPVKPAPAPPAEVPPAVVQRAHPKTPALASSLQNPELWQGL